MSFNSDLMRAFLAAAAAVLATNSAASPSTCRVIDGVVAHVAPGPFVDQFKPVTLKSAWSAEYRWNLADPEAIAWMRITDESGTEIGWVPAGQDGITCGGSN